MTYIVYVHPPAGVIMESWSFSINRWRKWAFAAGLSYWSCATYRCRKNTAVLTTIEFYSKMTSAKSWIVRLHVWKISLKRVTSLSLNDCRRSVKCMENVSLLGVSTPQTLCIRHWSRQPQRTYYFYHASLWSIKLSPAVMPYYGFTRLHRTVSYRL